MALRTPLMSLLLTGLGLTLVACTADSELGGGDPGWQLDDDPFSAAYESQETDTAGSSGDPDIDDDGLRDDPSAAVLSAICDEEGLSENSENSLTATASGSTVTAVHAGLVTHCAASWSATALVNYNDLVADIAYTDLSGETPTEEGCWCAWTVTTEITQVPSGEWTITALGDSTQTTVP